MVKVENPILPGFNADPSAIKVGDEFYVVTSTFNWSPGVALYSSKDLKNWKLVNNILDRESQLNMKGNPDSCGVWAPQISYCESNSMFYLTYTDVKSLSDSFFDLNNYMVSSPTINGPWSDPIYLNSSGFDPSIFHDDNGKSYLLNLAWEFRDDYPHPGPIIIQELDLNSLQLVGDSEVIYRGNPNFGCTEGPHIFKKDGYYYLITAEGGTGYGHAVKIARSESVLGPYIESPNGPLLTCRANLDPILYKQDPDFLKPQFFNPELAIQKAGHGSIVHVKNDEYALFHLMSRPVMPQMRCILNRETGVQKMAFKDGWPILTHGNPYPLEEVEFCLPPSDSLDVTQSGCIEFNSNEVPKNFYSLKDRVDEGWCSLSREPGFLSIRGRNSPYSAHDYSVLSRRVQHFNCDIETQMNFTPENIRTWAGLVIQTGSRTFYYLRYFYSEYLNSTAIGLLISKNGSLTRESSIPINCNNNLKLKISLRNQTVGFYYAESSSEYIKLGDSYDATVLSDEFTNSGPGAFDGTFVGLSACDLDRQKVWAKFKYFKYSPL